MGFSNVKKALVVLAVSAMGVWGAGAADDAANKKEQRKQGDRQRQERPQQQQQREPQTPLGMLMQTINEQMQKSQLANAKLEIDEDTQFYQTLQNKTPEQMAVEFEGYLKKQAGKSTNFAAIQLSQAMTLIKSSGLTDEEKSIAFLQVYATVYNKINQKTSYVQLKVLEFTESLKTMDREARREAMQKFFQEIRELGGMEAMGGMRGGMMGGRMQRPGGDRGGRGERPEGNNDNNQKGAEQPQPEMF